MIDEFFYTKYLKNAILNKGFSLMLGELTDRVSSIYSLEQILNFYVKNGELFRQNNLVPIGETQNKGLILVRYHMICAKAVYYYNEKYHLLLMLDEEPEWLIEK